MTIEKMKRDTILGDIKRLYEITAEMREIVGRLRETEVEVRITRSYSKSDPLEAFANLMIMLRPGCELDDKS